MAARRKEPGAGKPTGAKIESALLALLAQRGTSTTCPSEVARKVDALHWRPLMPLVREVVARLQQQQQVDVYQHGRPVHMLQARGPVRLRLRAAVSVDYRKHPERYQIGRGEEGVLTVEPYKSELLPLWRFRTPELALASARALWKQFKAYGAAGDFVGMDMARKFIQMGWTRSRRYANYPGGRKYAQGTRDVLPRKEDPTKAESAAIFRKYYQRALEHGLYQQLRQEHKARAGRSPL